MIADLKPYPEMKDSGVPWLGEVPEHWELLPLGRYLRVKSGDMISAEDERESGVPIYGGNGIRGYTFKSNTRGPTILLGRVGAKCGCVHLVDGEFWASEHALRVIPQADINLRFLALTLGHADLNRLAIRTAQPLINSTIVRTHPATFPPLPEQGAVVRFLGHADRRIQRYIRAKQQLIKLLEEQKQAIVHRAITRGLDPNVRFKLSGVEWLGQVPEHWDVSQLRRLVRRGRRITYGIVQPGEPDGSGRFMVRGQDYSFGWTRPEAIFRVSDAIETPYKRSRLMTGDILLTIVGAGVGNVAIVPAWLDGANITQTTARVSVDPTKANAEFVAAVLEGPVGRRNVEQYVKGAAQPGLNLEHVRVFLLPVPPVQEQSRIVEVIRSETAPLEAAADRARREIALLREYRHRLIADVVTGKLDVREAAAQLLEEGEEPELCDEAESDIDTAEPAPGGLGEVAEQAEV
jgi:type I restriction enzyme S subunit